MPQFGQARASRVGARARLALDRRPAPSCRLPSRSAVSTESVRRARSPASMRDAVDHELDRVLLLLVERGDVLEPHDHAVDAHAREAGLARLVEQLAELALAVLGLAARAASRCVLAGSVSSSSTISAAERAVDRAAALVAALLAGARVEHAQVVVDLGDRADGRARVRRRRLLLDRDRRRQPADAARTSASPSGRGTGARTTTATRRSGAGPRRRACRTPATTCPSPTRPVNTTSERLGISSSSMARLCSRAPATTMKSGSSARGRYSARSRALAMDVGSFRLTSGGSLAPLADMATRRYAGSSAAFEVAFAAAR